MSPYSRKNLVPTNRLVFPLFIIRPGLLEKRELYREYDRTATQYQLMVIRSK